MSNFKYLTCPHCNYEPVRGETMNIVKDGDVFFGIIFNCNNCKKEYKYYPLLKAEEWVEHIEIGATLKKEDV